TVKPVGGQEVIVSSHLYIYASGKLKKHYQIIPGGLFSSFTPVHNDDSGFYFDSNYKLESEISRFDAASNPVELKLKNKTQSIYWDGEEILATVINSD